ncbi:hypothetical protein N9H39_08595 [Gammaproteobacteria bacterium]|nr:hypothetical protein [Gammaproteobacteria bacterium]
MRTKKFINIVLASLFLIPLSGFAKNDQGGGNHYVFRLFGTGTAYENMVPDGSGGEMAALCFDVNLMDLKNRQVVGTAIDCLSEIVDVGGNIDLIGTTFFNLPRGTLITQGLTSVRPARPGTETDVGPITHITGAASTGNAIIDGTKRFTGATGTARLSGMVNLAVFGGAAGTDITFDCIFDISLD